jgi:hypothetical protein
MTLPKVVIDTNNAKDFENITDLHVVTEYVEV